MHFLVAIAKLTRQPDNVADCHFGHRARIAEWRVERGDSATRRVLQIDLVRADAKTPNDQQLHRVLKSVLIERRFTANADNMHVLNLLYQFLFRQRLGVALDLITLKPECVNSGLVDILQEQHFDFVRIERPQVLWLNLLCWRLRRTARGRHFGGVF